MTVTVAVAMTAVGVVIADGAVIVRHDELGGARTDLTSEDAALHDGGAEVHAALDVAVLAKLLELRPRLDGHGDVVRGHHTRLTTRRARREIHGPVQGVGAGVG